MDWNAIAALFGKVVAIGGGSVAVAYAAFVFLGKKWIENTFQARLNSLKHAHDKELQRLKVEIDSLLGATLKLQEREFEVLPEAWRLLDEAKSTLAWVVSPLQQYPDLNRMNAARFDDFMSRCELRDVDKDEIRAAPDKNKVYTRLIVWHNIGLVRKAQNALYLYVAKNAIFFPKEMKERYVQICKLMSSSVAAKQVGHEVDDWKLQTQSWEKLEQEIEPLYQEIEKESRARLRAHADGKPVAG